LKSLIGKRSVVIRGLRTSVSLEPDFWSALRAIAKERGKPLSDILGEIDHERRQTNLSSAIRLFVLHNISRAPIEANQALGAPNGGAQAQTGRDIRSVGLRDPSFLGLV
jgi:predicted DNA-binding ribbon-helix-helix protein